MLQQHVSLGRSAIDINALSGRNFVAYEFLRLSPISAMRLRNAAKGVSVERASAASRAFNPSIIEELVSYPASWWQTHT